MAAGERSARARLSALAKLRAAPPEEAVPALEGSAAPVVARAAEIAGARRLAALLPKAEAALERFLALPAEKDKGSVAKTALAAACDDLGSREARLFLRGARCVQLEPGGGGAGARERVAPRRGTAPPLRDPRGG